MGDPVRSCEAVSAEELAGALMAAGVDLKAVDPKDWISARQHQHIWVHHVTCHVPSTDTMFGAQDVLLALDPHGCKQIFVPDLIQFHVPELQTSRHRVCHIMILKILYVVLTCLSTC